MKYTKYLIILVFLVIVFSGCTEPQEPNFFKGIKTAPIPESCVEYNENVCGLFDCMVDSCWCEESPDAITSSNGNTIITSEEEAMEQIQNHIFTPYNTMPKGIVVERAVKLNPVFYNVFVDNQGDEEVYTVAADGTIIKTVCGV